MIKIKCQKQVVTKKMSLLSTAWYSPPVPSTVTSIATTDFICNSYYLATEPGECSASVHLKGSDLRSLARWMEVSLTTELVVLPVTVTGSSLHSGRSGGEGRGWKSKVVIVKPGEGGGEAQRRRGGGGKSDDPLQRERDQGPRREDRKRQTHVKEGRLVKPLSLDSINLHKEPAVSL